MNLRKYLGNILVILYILPLDDQMLLGSTPLIPEAKILRKLVALGRVAPRKLFFSLLTLPQK